MGCSARMAVIAVKKYCVKKGRVYGPYPKDLGLFYLYRVYRDGESVRQKYLGVGLKPKDAVVQEIGCHSCKHFTVLENTRLGVR